MKNKNRPKYSRVLLKLSGEAWAARRHGHRPEAVQDMAQQIREVRELGRPGRWW